LKAAVQILGPEYAKMLARARASAEELCKKAPGPGAAEEASVDADKAAWRAYGLEPDVNVLRQFAALLGVMRDGAQFTRWFVSGDQMQIWIKEEMLSFLKGGRKLPDFSLDRDGEGVSWNSNFSMPGQFSGGDKAAEVSPADARAKVVERMATAPHPVYPIILKRADLPEKLEDAAAVAAAIRAGDEKVFSIIREAGDTPGKALRDAAAFGPLFDQEQSWFIVAHEVTESAIVGTVIKSADRRWFCDGLANWVAMRQVDRRFGPGKGAEVFARLYPADNLRKQAADVDLLAWPAGEDVENGGLNVKSVPAYYYFATLVMMKACEGRGADFIQQWLDEIRKTPQNRANAGTVLAAYQKLTGKDLKSMIGEVVRE